jgi:hypothetical protein
MRRYVALLLFAVPLYFILMQCTPSPLNQDTGHLSPAQSKSDPPSLAAVHEPTSSILGSERLSHASQPEPYCAASATARATPSAVARFAQRHPELAISADDLTLILAEMDDIWQLAAMAYTDHDSKALNVLRKGRYHGRDVRTLAKEASDGEPEAALIYGSYLMQSGYLDPNNPAMPINRAAMAEGRAMLLRTAQTGDIEALYRIYSNTQIAARIAWRRFGRSHDWQALDQEQAVLEEWFLQSGPSHGAAALIQYDRDMPNAPQNPIGEPYPTATNFAPSELEKQLSDLNQLLNPKPLSQDDRQTRDQLLWLQSRNLIEAAMLAWGQECNPDGA